MWGPRQGISRHQEAARIITVILAVILSPIGIAARVLLWGPVLTLCLVAIVIGKGLQSVGLIRR